LDFGINFVDTADRYSNGESEEIVGKALKGRRQNVVLATKVNGAMGERPEPAGQFTALDYASSRGVTAPSADRPHRPLPNSPAFARHRHRGEVLELAIQGVPRFTQKITEALIEPYYARSSNSICF